MSLPQNATVKRLASAAESTDWRHRAACKDEDPELHHPIGNAGHALDRQIAEAKAVCARCPVAASCLDFAIDTRQTGIAGGLTEDERRKLSRDARPLPAEVTVIRRPDRKPTPADRREDALRWHAAGLNPAEIGLRLGVHQRQVERWIDASRAGVAA